MGIILWIIFGALVGWIASIIMKGEEEGLMMDIIIGIIGAVIGGWIMSILGESGVGGFNLYSFLVAILGACVLLAVVKVLKR